jgi:hypothetical protein
LHSHTQFNSNLHQAVAGCAGPIDVTIGDKEIDANLRSVIVSAATVLPHLKAQPSAYIINISSGHAPWHQDGGLCAYCRAFGAATVIIGVAQRQNNPHNFEPSDPDPDPGMALVLTLHPAEPRIRVLR